MFKRNVMNEDGTVTTIHEVVGIRHSLKNDITYVDVESSVSESHGAARSGTYGHVLEIGMTFEDAEEWVKTLDDFKEYVDEAQEMLDELAGMLTDEQAATVPQVFHEWEAEADYTVGVRLRYGSKLYKCLIAHTSVEGQSPDVAVSLWACILNPDPDVIPVWEQPDSTNPYMIGDRVHYPDADGPVYESTIDNNVFSPEAYPQGWQLVQ